MSPREFMWTVESYTGYLETDERIEMPAKAEIRKTFMIN